MATVPTTASLFSCGSRSSDAFCPRAPQTHRRRSLLRPPPPLRLGITRDAGTQQRWTGAAAADGPPNTFLTLEEAGLIEMSKLDMHERFLARLTVSSLNLLRVISEQEGIPIEQLNAGLVCDWFVKDKAKREKDINTATLRWDAGPEW